MYQKHFKSDELFTSISLSFSLLLLTLFLVYEKLASNLTGDMDYYFYIAVSSLFFILFVYTSVFFILNYNYKILDIGIDMERECVTLKNGHRTLPFRDITFFGYNKKKKDVRLLIGGKLYGFLLENVLNEKNEAITEEQILVISEHTKTIKHQHLYNFNLLVSIIMVISLYLYAFVNTSFTLFGISVTTLYLFIIAIVVYLIVDQSNRFRYRKLLIDKEKVIEITKKESDTN